METMAAMLILQAEILREGGEHELASELEAGAAELLAGAEGGD